MKNLKQKIESRREAMDEASGFGKKKSKKSSYEDDFNRMVSVDEMEMQLEQLDREYKKARTESEKMSILKKKNKLRAKIQIAKESE